MMILGNFPYKVLLTRCVYGCRVERGERKNENACFGCDVVGEIQEGVWRLLLEDLDLSSA